MCISAEVSYAVSGLLIAGGGYCLYKARQVDRRYIPLALFPLVIGVQQAAEGYVWSGFAAGNAGIITTGALIYLFFTWIFWPSWVPFMTACLEPDAQSRKARILKMLAAAGLIHGILLYLPNYFGDTLLRVATAHHAIAYHCHFITEPLVPRWAHYMLYLALVGLPPLFSSHLFLRIFGASLIAAIPLTYAAFAYAHISVLCFFAALITLYLVYVIATDKCAAGRAPHMLRHS